MRQRCVVTASAAAHMARVPKSGFLSTSDGVRLHYLEAGAGPAILFVPGWTMPAEIWAPQLRHFSSRFRAVAMDPRSQGDSAQVTEGHYPERRAQDIKEVVDHLQLAPVVLVGWSMAVAEILTCVERFGAAWLRALVLVDGVIAQRVVSEQFPESWAWVRQMQRNRPVFTANFVRSMHKTPQPDAYLERITAAALKTPTNTAVTLLANVSARGDFRSALAKLDRPLLYVVTPALHAQTIILKSRYPAARIETFHDAGHALFADQPDRFNALVEEFLREGN